jgi:hypothetical protein
MGRETAAKWRKRLLEHAAKAGIPDDVLVAIILAIKRDSEAPLRRLPPEWSTRMIATWREWRVTEGGKLRRADVA